MCWCQLLTRSALDALLPRMRAARFPVLQAVGAFTWGCAHRHQRRIHRDGCCHPRSIITVIIALLLLSFLVLVFVISIGIGISTSISVSASISTRAIIGGLYAVRVINAMPSFRGCCRARCCRSDPMCSGLAEPVELYSVQPIASPLMPLRTFAPHLRKIDLVLPGEYWEYPMYSLRVPHVSTQSTPCEYWAAAHVRCARSTSCSPVRSHGAG